MKIHVDAILKWEIYFNARSTLIKKYYMIEGMSLPQG